MKQRHDPMCMINISCCVDHGGAPCHGPYGKCNCSLSTATPTDANQEMADLHDEIAHIETTPPPTVSKDWEVQFAKIVKGRKQSKYHRNYIATHVVEDFIRKTLATQRKEIASAVTEVLVGFDVENRSASELHKEVSEAIQAIERLG